MKREWKKPIVEILNVNMTMVSIKATICADASVYGDSDSLNVELDLGCKS